MNTPTISFFISLAAIIAMISLRSFELRSGKKSWLSYIARMTDPIIEKIYDKIRRIISYFNWQSAIALTQWIAYHVLSWARAVYLWVLNKAHAHPRSKKVIDMVRGRGEAKKNGQASGYLKNISNSQPKSPDEDVAEE